MVAVENGRSPKVRLLRTLIDPVDKPAAVERLREFLAGDTPRQITTVNLDFVRIAAAAPQFNQVINEADLAVPDGAPIVWAAKYLGLECERVTGLDLIEACAALSHEHGYRLYFLGAAPGVPERAIEALRARYPAMQVSGAFAPPEAAYPFPAALSDEIVARVRRARPHALFVAFGCPKQDLWIRDHKDELGVPVSIGVGGSFALIGGVLPRAPQRMQRWGLEWLHRLYTEPGRLGRRYLLQDAPFAARILAAEAGRRIGLSQAVPLALEL